jgi:hypothetical protein
MGLLSSRQPKHNKTPYTYRPLSTLHSIRLLNIEYAPQVAGINRSVEPRYSIFETTIGRVPGYETLSYTWGTTKQDKHLALVDGTHLPITKTLEQSLPYIVRHSTTNCLWIDQICINQNDEVERSRQVLLMGEIYSKCQCVLVWPGLLTRLHQDLEIQIHELKDLASDGNEPCSQCERQIIKKMNCCEPGPKPLRVLCREVVTCLWFSRAWVFQEIVLPSRSNLFW